MYRSFRQLGAQLQLAMTILTSFHHDCKSSQSKAKHAHIGIQSIMSNISFTKDCQLPIQIHNETDRLALELNISSYSYFSLTQLELLQYSDGRGSYINPCLALTISYQIGFRELDQLTISNTLIVSIQFQTMEPRTPIASSSVHPRHGFYSHQLALPSK